MSENRYFEIQFARNSKFFLETAKLVGQLACSQNFSKPHCSIYWFHQPFNRSLPGYPLFKTPQLLNKGTIAGTQGAPKFCLAFYLPSHSRVSLDRDQVTRSPRFHASYFRLHRGDDRPPLSSRIVALVNEPFYREASAAARDYRSPRESWNSTRTSMPLVVVELQRGKKQEERRMARKKGRRR